MIERNMNSLRASLLQYVIATAGQILVINLQEPIILCLRQTFKMLNIKHLLCQRRNSRTRFFTLRRVDLPSPDLRTNR